MRLCASILLSVLLFLVSPAFAQLGKPEVLYYKSWAVVIGINDYLVPPKLQAAGGNAKAMADTLRKLGFDEVVELYDKDASFRRLSSIFNDYLPRKVGRQDRVVIYFAGHSGITKDMNGKDLGHMVPWDAPTTNAAKGITMDELKASSRRVM